MASHAHFDAVIIGGGAAGLWTLDELVRRGRSVLLLEGHALGHGQTIASQGIIHGGLKYTLKGAFTRSAGAIAEMPIIWRECLAGRREPKLQSTLVRAQFCHLWRTQSIASKLGMIGARVGLRVKPVAIARDDRPLVLADCPGTVQRIDEQVIDPSSFLNDLFHRHERRIIKVDPRGLRLRAISSRQVAIELQTDRHNTTITTDNLILTAGESNAALRETLTENGGRGPIKRNGGRTPIFGGMQRRPLHMVMLRGHPQRLPELNGHCVDGARTSVTVTTARDSAGRNVWQFGGQLAEDGVDMEPPELIAHAKRELRDSLAGFELHHVEWSTYSVDRAEGATESGARPDDVTIINQPDAAIITAWPTKLALVPELARRIAECIKPIAPQNATRQAASDDLSAFNAWPRPAVALPPWETATQWFADA